MNIKRFELLALGDLSKVINDFITFASTDFKSGSELEAASGKLERKIDDLESDFHWAAADKIQVEFIHALEYAEKTVDIIEAIASPKKKSKQNNVYFLLETIGDLMELMASELDEDDTPNRKIAVKKFAETKKYFTSLISIMKRAATSLYTQTKVLATTHKKDKE